MKLDLKNKTSIAIIAVAAILLEATSLIQYWYSREGIREEVVHRAQTELKVKSLTIKNATLEVETAARNMMWVVEENLQYPDSMYSVIRRLLINNPNILGCGITFKPNYYQSKGYWYEPYGARRENGVIETTQLGGENHDYTKSEFYLVPMQTGQPQWSEPYLDSDGARAMLTTYSLPIHSSNGEIVGIMGLDVSLDWMNEYLNSQRIYPSSYNIVVSRKGQLMVAPVESLSMRYTVQELASVLEDTTYEVINNAMMAGESGQSSVIDNDGEKNYVFYGPIEGNTGWSMAVVALDKEIYSNLRQIAFVLFILMLIGLLLIGIILDRSAKNFRRLQKVNAEKGRIGSELRIASGIQRGMLPRVFPPYPERNDIDVFAFLDSAKEVGGDLFDFYIREEKLLFCIGDVSGKGVPASLVMAVTRSLFRTISVHQENVGLIVKDMNNAMSEMNEDNMFVTLFIGKLDLATGLLQYCNAGHCAPLLIGQGVEKMETNPNIPLALMNGWDYVEKEIQLKPKTTVFLYTDGLIEAEDVSKRLFGEERMIEEVQKALDKGNNSAEQLIKSMDAAVKHFVGGAQQSDDLTLLAVKYLKEDLA